MQSFLLIENARIFRQVEKTNGIKVVCKHLVQFQRLPSTILTIILIFFLYLVKGAHVF